ncbi:MAG: hypothetical protein Q8R93_17305 [Methylicorpusculum sp.]|nr:hypothetical protein [Methylicorpusculum sp.]
MDIVVPVSLGQNKIKDNGFDAMNELNPASISFENIFLGSHSNILMF